MTRSIRSMFFRSLPGVSLSFALALLLFLPAGMRAQDAPPPPPQNTPAPPDQGAPPPSRHGHPNPQRQLKHMTKMLNLSSDQQQQILPILQDKDQQMKALWSNSSLSPQQRHTQMRSINENSKQKLEAVLNDTQKQQYEDMLAKNRDRMQEHRQQMQQSVTPPPDTPDSASPVAPPNSGTQPQ